MFEVDLSSNRPDPDVRRFQDAIAHALELKATEGACAALMALLIEGGIKLKLRDEGYYGEALNYHLGLAHAAASETAEAIACMEAFPSLPSSGGPMLYADHVRDSLEIQARREAAAARGLPTFFIASMPRSASATLTQTLSSLLDMPHLRVSIGRMPEFPIVPRWLAQAARGGAVLHDHFGATEHNLSALRNAGVKDVFVLMRDPRAAGASAFALDQKEGGADAGQTDPEAATIAMIERVFIPWLDGWMRAAEQGAPRIHWIHSSDVRTEVAGVWSRMCDVLQPAAPALGAYRNASLDVVRQNFNHGDDDAWRARIGEGGQARLWQAMSDEMRGLLRLKR